MRLSATTTSPPPPPAPREFSQSRARKTYECILQAAAELYSERGFHSVQTPDIAKRAGVSVGGLYRYFTDKHQIFTELVHRILESNRLEQDQMIADLQRKYGDEEIDVRGVARCLIDWTWAALHNAPPDLLQTLESMRYGDAEFGQLWDQYNQYNRMVIARMFAKITTRDAIPSPLATAQLIVLIMPTVAVWTEMHPSDSCGVKEALMDMVFSYLDKPSDGATS